MKKIIIKTIGAMATNICIWPLDFGTTAINPTGMTRRNGISIVGKRGKPVFRNISLILSNNAFDSVSEM